MKRFLQISVLLFVLVNAALFLLKGQLAGWNMTAPPLVYGNAWLFGITLLAFYLELKGVRQTNAYAFFRYVYTGMLLKLFLSVGVVLLYALTDRAALTRGVVLLWLLLYICYTALEVSGLVREGKVKR
jgi:uncharacterized membrane protein